MNKEQLYIAVFGEAYVQERYSYVGHSMKRVAAGKTYCEKCGLVAGKNKFSQWAFDKGCKNKLHSNYNQKREKFTGGIVK